MVELAEDLGVDEVTFYNLIPYDIHGFPKDQCLYDNDADVIKIIKSIPSSKSNLEVVMPRLYEREYLDRRCHIPFRILTIDPKGNISPCCMTAPWKSYGNVFTDKHVWNNSVFQQEGEILVDKSLPLPDFCKTCSGMVTEWRLSYVPHRRDIR